MQLEVGKIYEGKVTGITKFGAFVELDKDTTGMVHISEVANTFVNDISEHLKEGQDVKVKVLALNDGKIALSIKKALPAPEKSGYIQLSRLLSQDELMRDDSHLCHRLQTPVVHPAKRRLSRTRSLSAPRNSPPRNFPTNLPEVLPVLQLHANWIRFRMTAV